MKRQSLFLAAGVLALGLPGCVDRAAQKQAKATEAVVNNPIKPVTVTAAVSTDVTETVSVTGDVTASDDTTIGSKQNNKVVAVYVKDGDAVKQGQLLALLDDSGAQAQLRQAQAQVTTALAAMATAKSQVDQANRNLQVGPHRSTVQVLLARASVQASQKNLDKLINGARPEERRQAVANLESAKANLELQKKQLERTKKLVEEGAVSGQTLDQQKAAYDQAVAQYKSAQEAVNINENGSRPEDVDAARAELRQQIESLHNAEDQKKLDPLLKDQVDAANAQMESARAQLASARAQIQIAMQTVSDTKIIAPFDGHVSGRPIQVGTVAGANTAIVRVVSGAGVYFNGQVPSSYIDKLKVGQAVSVRVDGIADKVFPGNVVGINPLADSVGRLFSVRVQLTGPTAEIRPGMFARGTVAVRTIPGAVVVPTVSVVSRGDDRYVFTVSGNKAKQVKVTVGLTKGDTTQVTGVQPGDKVVTAGQETLLDGAPVTVKETTTAFRAGTKLSGEDKS